MYDVIVIGGGASGLMAAGRAAQCGAKTLLIEKMPRLGIKLSITGNRRCNLTNAAPIHTHIEKCGAQGRSLHSLFAHFSNNDTMDFFEKRGIPLTIKPSGEVFPSSNKASDIVSALACWIQEQGVTVLLNHRVTNLLVSANRVTGVTATTATKADTPNSETSEASYQAKSVILATGGASYPQTGSSGDGYQLAARVGHSIVPIRPALVPLITPPQFYSALQGLSLTDVSLTLNDSTSRSPVFRGDMLFTHYGISGPLILNASKQVITLLKIQNPAPVAIDLFPDVSEPELDQVLHRVFEQHKRQYSKTALSQLLSQRLAVFCLQLTGLSESKQCGQISKRERSKLVSILKRFGITITGYRPLAEAMITSGGIPLTEVTMKTLESRKCKGLYFSGEILDIDAETGGYNLQIAFSTGWIAAEYAAQSAVIV